MEQNYILSNENENSEPTLECLNAILLYSKIIQSFNHNDIRFKFNLN